MKLLFALIMLLLLPALTAADTLSGRVVRVVDGATPSTSSMPPRSSTRYVWRASTPRSADSRSARRQRTISLVWSPAKMSRWTGASETATNASSERSSTMGRTWIYKSSDLAMRGGIGNMPGSSRRWTGYRTRTRRISSRLTRARSARESHESRVLVRVVCSCT